MDTTVAKGLSVLELLAKAGGISLAPLWIPGRAGLVGSRVRPTARIGTALVVGDGIAGFCNAVYETYRSCSTGAGRRLRR
jgi:hypothetical protein